MHPIWPWITVLCFYYCKTPYNGEFSWTYSTVRRLFRNKCCTCIYSSAYWQNCTCMDNLNLLQMQTWTWLFENNVKQCNHVQLMPCLNLYTCNKKTKRRQIVTKQKINIFVLFKVHLTDVFLWTYHPS